MCLIVRQATVLGHRGACWVAELKSNVSSHSPHFRAFPTFNTSCVFFYFRNQHFVTLSLLREKTVRFSKAETGLLLPLIARASRSHTKVHPTVHPHLRPQSCSFCSELVLAQYIARINNADRF